MDMLVRDAANNVMKDAANVPILTSVILVKVVTLTKITVEEDVNAVQKNVIQSPPKPIALQDLAMLVNVLGGMLKTTHVVNVSSAKITLAM